MHGITLSVFALMFLVSSAIAQDIRSETTCQTHKRNSQASTAAVKWDIRCDDQGYYIPLQCTKDSPKWCACYNKEEAITQPSRSTKACECYLARENALKNSASECETPKCATNGKFEAKQCCSTTGKCHCVNTTTGVRTTEPTTNRNLQCS
ncbi:U24-ctenitoxin-Pn1a-like [Stegodyphus dumicola]|uniref:U24-ctenitoxin-Pn1a-like n=1 Tax=Stegodyphus dumicola TaxID=202533 RepID=UPI0015B22585|nr:U24-ctenitoxin-Pn1a-like [Stegodyphus dumicola]XP_035226913.1 U24-ctenitoxin-Pn1a-like [Stegodyphus dumicola]